MSGSRSREALSEFLEYVEQKGLIPTNTAQARRASVGKVLRVLDEHEAQDVTAIDLDDAMLRFSNLYGKGYTPQSLNTYKSRVRSSLDDFASYLENPLAFKPNVQVRERRPVSDKDAGPSGGKPLKGAGGDDFQQSTSASTKTMLSSILPIPLRADLTVHIQGLPYNLTEAEAQKIANVVKAMASSA